MLITDCKQLEKFAPKYRLWQGISSIECTKKGRIFLTFYSGGDREEIRNYCLLLMSDDGGKTFRDPVAVVFDEKERYFDPCIWIDPLDRLWFTFCHTRQGEYDLCAVVCENPDADVLVFSEEKRIGDGVMMCKPTVLSTGEWLFPIAKWRNGRVGGDVPWNASNPSDRKAFVYRTLDNGKTFERLGGVDAPTRAFDEHMVVEKKDGSLWMLIRCTNGIAEAYSWDGGQTWSEPTMSEIKGPDARFFIRRLSSGNLLLLNHYNFVGRSNMTALLSDDDGKTWKWKMLLDARSVSYPDAVEADGKIYITYDFERGGYQKTLEDNYAFAREILWARITEEDVKAGQLVDKNSMLSAVASRLGKYEGGVNLCENRTAR